MIIVGQCFSNYNLISFEQELGYYCKMIEEYLKSNYKIYWKGHPRSQKFDELIQKKYKNRVDLITDNFFPVETLLYKEDIELAGVSSSALLYNQYIFKNQTTQIAYQFIDSLNVDSLLYKDFVLMLMFIDRKIPKLLFHNA